MSIRWRLILLNLALLAVSLITLAITAYIVLARNLSMAVDVALQARAQQVVGAARVTEGFFISRVEIPPVDEFAEPGVYVQVVDTTRGEIVTRSKNLGDQHLPVQRGELLANLRGQSVFSTLKVGTVEIKVYSTPLIDAHDQVVGVVQVGRSLADLDNTLRRLRLVLTGGVAVVLLIASGFNYLFIRAGLRPLDEMSQMARRIGRAEDLSQRLKYDGPPDEVGRLAVTFNEMLERLERAFSAQRRFVADASHALRTPLTAIRGNAELLLQQRDDPAAQEASLRAIQRETERTARLVSDLLLLAQADAGQKLDQQQPVEMATLLLDVYQQARVVSDGVVLSLGHEDQGLVLGDPDRLKEVLWILVDNALKYTPAGGRVTLSLYYNSPWVQVSVADTGPGIPLDDLPHIFERFYRVKGIKPRPGRPMGTGLGLAIAKWIVEAHGGHITVESQPGKGTTFTVWLRACES